MKHIICSEKWYVQPKVIYGTMQVKRGERWSTVGYAIHSEINFLSKVYSKSLLKVGSL